MKKSRDSFTLIEMLVVISVIAILAGISFKLVQISKRTADRAKTVSILEKVAHALNEYKAEYGMYPPVAENACSLHSGCRVCYQYENTNNQSSYAIVELMANPDLVNLFDMGLVSFLEERQKAGFHTDHLVNKEWVPDEERDELAKARWQVFIDGVIVDGGPASNKFVVGGGGGGGGGGTWVVNSSRTIKDAWGNIIKYECDPPYLSYKLWSGGPTADPNDDLHKNSWDN